MDANVRNRTVFDQKALQKGCFMPGILGHVLNKDLAALVGLR